MSEVPPRKPESREGSIGKPGESTPPGRGAGRGLSEHRGPAEKCGPAATGRSTSPTIQLLPAESKPQATYVISGQSRLSELRPGPDSEEASGSSWGYALGFLLAVAGAIGAALPAEKWSEWLAWAGEPWTGEPCRWILSGVLVLAGISFLNSKPFSFLVTSGLVLLTVYCVDVMIGRKLSAAINAPAGIDIAGRVLPVAAIALGYLIHTSRRVGPLSVRGILALILIGFAGVAVVNGWYDQCLDVVTPRLGDGVRQFASEWNEECTWAMALILVAIGVAASRTGTVHFLGAILLGALAYHCIQAGCAKVVTFPNANGIAIPDLPTVSLANVVLWRWVAAGELVLLAIILLHMSLGMGALNIAFALTWMVAGMAAYHEIGSLSLARLINQGVTQSGVAGAASKPADNPLAMWGLPLNDPRTMARPAGAGRGPATSAPGASGRIPAQPPTAEELEKARAEAKASLQSDGVAELQSQTLVREIVPLAWMYLTAILAGIIGIAGFRMLSGNPAGKFWLALCLCVALAAGCTWLGMKWPRDEGQSWLSWAAAFRESRYHVYLIWLVFLGSMAVAGIWALLSSTRASSWIHGSIYCTFIGTILTLVGVAILIRFGGFPRLPVWTYIAIAAGQSSMAWVLLMHLSLSARPGRQGS